MVSPSIYSFTINDTVLRRWYLDLDRSLFLVPERLNYSATIA